MRILLLGEYSNVHNGLAEGLRLLNHDVCVISDGDSWKNYPRDLDISRKSTGLFDTFRYLIRLQHLLPKMRGYDVVQLINPMFLELRAPRIKKYYDYIRRNNKKVFLGAFGMDYYWVKTCLDCKTFRYSDFNIGEKKRIEETFNKEYIADWLNGEKRPLNEYIAKDCDGIICGLYEYYKCYSPLFHEKTIFIPFPINTDNITKRVERDPSKPIRFFIGIQKQRNEYKGTDVMMRALERIKKEYPNRCEIIKAESVPFAEYQQMINNSDILLDQLYSYTPGMNGLLAMSKGIVLVGGGEEEQYDLLGEKELRPIINVLPNEEDVYEKLKTIVLTPSLIDNLSNNSIVYIHRHHNYKKIAKQYIDFWKSK